MSDLNAVICFVCRRVRLNEDSPGEAGGGGLLVRKPATDTKHPAPLISDLAGRKKLAVCPVVGIGVGEVARGLWRDTRGSVPGGQNCAS